MFSKNDINPKKKNYNIDGKQKNKIESTRILNYTKKRSYKNPN